MFRLAVLFEQGELLLILQPSHLHCDCVDNKKSEDAEEHLDRILIFCVHLVLCFLDSPNNARPTWEHSGSTAFIYITLQTKHLKTALITLSPLSYFSNSIGLSLAS